MLQQTSLVIIAGLLGAGSAVAEPRVTQGHERVRVRRGQTFAVQFIATRKFAAAHAKPGDFRDPLPHGLSLISHDGVTAKFRVERAKPGKYAIHLYGEYLHAHDHMPGGKVMYPQGKMLHLVVAP